MHMYTQIAIEVIISTFWWRILCYHLVQCCERRRSKLQMQHACHIMCSICTISLATASQGLLFLVDLSSPRICFSPFFVGLSFILSHQSIFFIFIFHLNLLKGEWMHIYVHLLVSIYIYIYIGTGASYASTGQPRCIAIPGVGQRAYCSLGTHLGAADLYNFMISWYM